MRYNHYYQDPKEQLRAQEETITNLGKGVLEEAFRFATGKDLDRSSRKGHRPYEHSVGQVRLHLDMNTEDDYVMVVPQDIYTYDRPDGTFIRIKNSLEDSKWRFPRFLSVEMGRWAVGSLLGGNSRREWDVVAVHAYPDKHGNGAVWVYDEQSAQMMMASPNPRLYALDAVRLDETTPAAIANLVNQLKPKPYLPEL